MALWFANSLEASPLPNRNQYKDPACANDTSGLMLNFLDHVLENIVLREYQKSCNFSSSQGSIGSGASSTVQAFNTPFRGDHAETLIIT